MGSFSPQSTHFSLERNSKICLRTLIRYFFCALYNFSLLLYGIMGLVNLILTLTKIIFKYCLVNILSQNSPFDNNTTLAYNLQYIGVSYSGSINASCPVRNLTGSCVMVARTLWERLVRVQIPAPRRFFLTG